MDHQFHTYLIGYRTNLFQEENQVRTQLFCINILITVQFMLELFQREALFRTRQSGNHIAGQTVDFFFVHLFVASFGLGFFFLGIILFSSRTFQDEEVESHEGCPFKAQSLGTVRHRISQIRTGPVEYRHEIVGHNVNATFGQVAQAFLVVLDIFHEIARLRLDMFVYWHGFYDTPS